jgi:GDP-L-fucose synthase
MSKLLITGGNGFLGKHICQEMNKCKLNYLSPTSKELDLLDFNHLCSYLKDHKPDSILHAAGLCGGIIKNLHRPADFCQENTQMALNIYEGARLASITNIYSLGSVCMYPLNCPTPFKEDDIWNGKPENTNHHYGRAKRTLMVLGEAYRAQYGFTGAHLIPVNMYGIGDSFDDEKSHVIPALIKKFLHAKKNNLPEVECLGTGTATREFLFASDAAEAIVKTIAMNLDYSKPINLGSGKDISIKDLTQLIKRLTEYQGDITFNQDGLDGQPRRLLDVSRAKQILNWETHTTLVDGLKQTIDWYLKNEGSIYV